MGGLTGTHQTNLCWLCRYANSFVGANDQTAQHIPIWKVVLGLLKGGAEGKGGSKVMQGEVGSGRAPTRPSSRPTLELR